ncbi:MAG: formyltransferase family protein [Chloroflexi bacterium]|nr:formyltransferase family protein [Chloroflexota bacterium]
MSTGRGPGSRRLLSAVWDAIQSQGLPVEISYVFCSRERGETDGSDAFIRMAEEYGLPIVTLSFRRYRESVGADELDWRARYNQELLRLLVQRPADMLTLAGLLMVLDSSIVNAYPTLNLHPAAPGGPIGTWETVIWDLISTGATESGAMTQLATANVDQGPVVTLCRFPIRGPRLDPLWEQFGTVPFADVREREGEGNPLFAAIRREGVSREVPLLIETLRALADARVEIRDGRVFAVGRVPTDGIDLSEEIEAIVAANTRAH